MVGATANSNASDVAEARRPLNGWPPRPPVFGELLTLSNRIFENDNIVTILRGFFTDYYRISNKMRRVTQNHIRKSNHIGFY